MTDPATDPWGEDHGPRCWSCDELTALVDSNGDPYCAACVERDMEHAHERQIARYYGGSAPVTLDEQVAAAHAAKKGAT